VVCAISGEEGLRLAKEVKPMAITLDIIMPGMDGWAVLGALKSNPETASIPVVLITIEEKRDLGFTLGASDYLVKPISHVQLFDTLRKYKHGRVAGRVLVVEDEKTTRDLMVRLVRKEGWNVVEAGNGREALDRVAERKPDLIFLDLMMPVMDGFEFIRELRANKDYHSIPVVVVTAKDLTPEERQWLNGDVYRVFRKGSFSRDELLQQIREIILCEVKPAK
jgi:CheY-like chemotaxis protein